MCSAMQSQFVFAIAAACASVTGFAQEQSSLASLSLPASVSRPIKPKSAASLRFEVNRVLIPVTATDREDHQVCGLRKQDFRLFEDGTSQSFS